MAGVAAISRTTLINAGLFQATWFACVLGGPSGNLLWAAAAVTAMVWFSVRAKVIAADMILAGAAALVGFALDTIWIHLGVLDYHGATVAPLWIVLLWVGVALSLNHSLAMFQARPLLGGLLAGGSAPLSYLAGERLGGVLVPEPWLLGLVALVWFAVFALGFMGVSRIAGRVDLAAGGSRTESAPTGAYEEVST